MIDGDLLQKLLELATIASPFATTFAVIQWYLERRERQRVTILFYDYRTAQEIKDQAQLERVLTGLNTNSAAMSELSRLLSIPRRGLPK